MGRLEKLLAMCLHAGQLAMSGCRTSCLCTLFLSLDRCIACLFHIVFITSHTGQCTQYIFCTACHIQYYIKIYSCPMKKTVPSLMKFVTATSFIAKFVTVTFGDLYCLPSFTIVTSLIIWPFSPVAPSVSWYRSCPVCSWLVYEIYSRGGPP